MRFQEFVHRKNSLSLIVCLPGQFIVIIFQYNAKHDHILILHLFKKLAYFACLVYKTNNNVTSAFYMVGIMEMQRKLQQFYHNIFHITNKTSQHYLRFRECWL